MLSSSLHSTLAEPQSENPPRPRAAWRSKTRSPICIKQGAEMKCGGIKDAPLPPLTPRQFPPE